MSTLQRLALLVLIPLLVIACGAKNENHSKKSPKSPTEFVQQASFSTLAGDSVNVSHFKGKVVMIDFWETWCKPCIASFSGIQKLVKEYPDDFAALAVTPGFSDTPAKAREFAKNHDYDFTYLYDVNGLNQKLNVSGIPYKAFIDANGNFIKTKLGSAGPEGDYQQIKKIIEKYKKASLQSSPSK